MNKVLVIIIVFNGEHWIEKCLNSLEKDSLKSEILCIDNNSTDKSVDLIIENFPNVQIIKNVSNLGFGQANNIGFQYAIEKGFEFVFLLNQDTWVQDNVIYKLHRTYVKNYLKGILSPLHLSPNNQDLDFSFEFGLRSQTNSRFISYFLLNSSFKNEFYKVEFINAAAWFFSLDFLKEIGGFNPSFYHYGEDNNFGHRVSKFGYHFYIDPSAIIFHDCPQVPRRVYLGVQNTARRQYAEYLILLSNPKWSFKYNFREACLFFFSETIKSLFPFQKKVFFVQFRIFVFLLNDFLQIRINYYQSFKKGSFL